MGAEYQVSIFQGHIYTSIYVREVTKSSYLPANF